ncbi:hypothetical protein BJ165DRAFT_1468044 [Panaeolus papilionaceus]|nr:hypothetical protein BJ165DRAFT_1468044 [Panaeolus papilionaceus]
MHMPEAADEMEKDAINAPTTPTPSVEEKIGDPDNLSMLRVLFRRSQRLTFNESTTSSPAPTEATLVPDTPPPQIHPVISESLPGVDPTTPAAQPLSTVTPSIPDKSEKISRLKAELRASHVKYIQANNERIYLIETVESLERELTSLRRTTQADIQPDVSTYQIMEPDIDVLWKAYQEVKENEARLVKANEMLRNTMQIMRNTAARQATVIQGLQQAAKVVPVGGNHDQEDRIRIMAAQIERQKVELSRLNQQVRGFGKKR